MVEIIQIKIQFDIFKQIFYFILIRKKIIFVFDFPTIKWTHLKVMATEINKENQYEKNVRFCKFTKNVTSCFEFAPPDGGCFGYLNFWWKHLI